MFLGLANHAEGVFGFCTENFLRDRKYSVKVLTVRISYPEKIGAQVTIRNNFCSL